MPIELKKGVPVRQRVFVIEGEIIDRQFVDDEVKYNVEYVGADGETHTRWFTASELEAK